MAAGIILILLGIAFVFALMYINCRYKKVCKDLREKQKAAAESGSLSDALLQNVNAYILLVSPDFTVDKTNYYYLTGTEKTSRPKLVGELLRCRNGLDAGRCGAHELCATCPVRAAIQDAFDRHTGFKDLEASMTFYLLGGQDRTADYDVAVSGAILDYNGQEKILLTVQDVSFLKQIQRKLTEEKQRAEESDRLKSAFLANMSHEIRTPLNAIMGFSELLAISETPEDRKKYLEIIDANNSLLLQLINDILDLSKIEAGTLEFVFSDVALNRMLSDLEGVFRMKVGPQSKVVIRFNAPEEDYYIRTERNRVSQVVSNFISNAIKFTKEGHIDFGYEVREDMVYFYVKDTGTGISEDDQKKIFQRFVKLNAKKQGTGLGLSISTMIIERLGGQIGVESEPGKGSTFWFTLPIQPSAGCTANESTLSESSPVAESEPEVPVSVKGEGRKTLLIAEDMDDNYLLYQAFLAKDYRLLRANNGEEAISLFLQESPDAILMDLRMPVVDGYQATEAIRQMSSAVPIIAVTAFAFEEDRKKVLVSGFSEYLAKPIKLDSLLEKLKAVGV